jgi:hypothetical protein
VHRCLPCGKEGELDKGGGFIWVFLGACHSVKTHSPFGPTWRSILGLPGVSLSLPLARQVGWCCGRSIHWYVSRDVFVIYIHFVCCLVYCLFLSFGKGVIPSVPHLLWPGEFCPSMSDVVCYGERVRGEERERNNYRVEFFYVVCLGL